MPQFMQRAAWSRVSFSLGAPRIPENASAVRHRRVLAVVPVDPRETVIYPLTLTPCILTSSSLLAAIPVIARSEATKQSMFRLRLMDCFAALAMTVENSSL